MERVQHQWPPEAAALEGITSLMDAVRRADNALVQDDHATALDSAAPEMVANVPGGIIIDKPMLQMALQHKMISYDHYERVIERVLRRDNGEFVLMGAEVVTPKVDNQRLRETAEKRRFSEIWRFDDGRWLLCVRHAG